MCFCAFLGGRCVGDMTVIYDIPTLCISIERQELLTPRLTYYVVGIHLVVSMKLLKIGNELILWKDR